MSQAVAAPAGRAAGIGVGEAMRLALRDFYHQSWRLAIMNGVLSFTVLGLAVAGAYAPPALFLLVLAGPLAAALMHCAVTLAQTEELRFETALEGLRLHWRRGLELGLFAGVVLGGGIFALVFYARAHAFTLPLAFVVAYLLAAFAVLQLHLWPLAIAAPSLGFRAALRAAFLALLRRPGATLGLALLLLLVNLAGIAAAVMPFLTLTVAYSFLAAAHFALPRPSQEA